MAITEKIIVMPHTGQSPVCDSNGNIISTVLHDTGLKRVYISHEEDGVQIAGQQIGFIHPNGFMHFIIPQPPPEFVEMVKAEVEKTGVTVKRIGAPPPIEAQEE